MDRRGFFQFLASIPFVGKLIPEKGLPGPASNATCKSCDAFAQPAKISYEITSCNGDSCEVLARGVVWNDALVKCYPINDREQLRVEWGTKPKTKAVG